MSPVTESCQPEQFEALLLGQLDDGRERACMEHLSDCEPCRRELERRAAAPASWDEARQFLHSDAPDDVAALDHRADATLDFAQPARHPLQIQAVLDALAPSDDPRMLGRLGAYEVCGVVGAGAMGVVLKAADPSLDRPVAIKVLAPHLASSGAARLRFSREAKAAAAVLHPNVMAIHSVAKDVPLPYLVMPYLRGDSLQKRLDEKGPPPVGETLRIAAQIASGLAAAHAQGLVHRDIKPANILMEEGVERVAITDFGLARAVDDATMTRTGVIAGTPQYMSPEQARGESLDQRSDLFSLGAVMYATCTGRAPFRAETSYGVLRRITDDRPRPIREINPDVPEWLCGIVEKLMSKSKDDRFATAAEVAELLEDCLAHVQQPTTTPLPPSCFAEKAASPPPKPPAKIAADRSRMQPPWLIALAGMAVILAPILAGIFIVLQLGKGTLVIESDADDVPIRITQGEKIVSRLTVSRGDSAVRVAAGKYLVEIEGAVDGMTIKDGVVELQRGGKQIVRIVQRRRAANLPGIAKRNATTTPKLEGLVVTVADAFVEISIGSDDGVRPQMRFTVFRKNTYLGELEVAKVDADRAVARIVKSNTQEQICVGDSISNDVVQSNPLLQTDTATSQIKFTTPTGLAITFPTANRGDQPLICPVRLNLRRGETHRLELSRIPNYEGVELTASLEVRKATPETEAYLSHNAIPLALTVEDFDAITGGNLVTKVLLLPDRKSDSDTPGALTRIQVISLTRVDPGVDPIAEAERRGTIVAIFRCGDRDTHRERGGDDRKNPEAASQPSRTPTLAFHLTSQSPSSDTVEAPIEGEKERIHYHKKAIATAGDVAGAQVNRRPGGEIEIKLRFSPESAARVAEMARANLGKRLAVVADGKVVSALVIRGTRSNEVVLSGRDSNASAEQITSAIAAARAAEHEEAKAAAQPTRPTYKGRTLETWLDGLEGASADVAPTGEAAIIALRKEATREQLDRAMDKWSAYLGRERHPEQVNLGVRVLCALAGKEASERAVETIVSAIRKQPHRGPHPFHANRDLTRAITVALKQLDEPVVRARMFQEIEQGNSSSRWLALSFCDVKGGKQFASGPAPIEAVLAASHDAHPSVRERAIEKLARVYPGEAKAIERLRAALDDKDKSVVDEALQGLAKIDPNNEQLLRRLKDRARDNQTDVQIHAAGCLTRAAASSPAALAAVVKLLEEDAWGLRKRPGGPGYAYSGSTAVQPATCAREAAIRGLGDLGAKAKSAAKVLDKQLSHPDREIRLAAREVYEKVTGVAPPPKRE